MRVIGNMDMLQGKESFTTQMVMFMKANGITIKPMAMEYILMRKEQGTKATGRTISNMAKG